MKYDIKQQLDLIDSNLKNVYQELLKQFTAELDSYNTEDLEIRINIFNRTLQSLQRDYDKDYDPLLKMKIALTQFRLNACLQEKQSIILENLQKEINQLKDENPEYQKIILEEKKKELAEKSWGDGRKSNTVNHIIVLEDLNIGRLHRTKGQFLCSNNQKGNYCDPKLDMINRVTCKQCLKIVERIKSLKGSIRNSFRLVFNIFLKNKGRKI